MTHFTHEPARPGILQLILPFWRGPRGRRAFLQLTVILSIMFGGVYLSVWAIKLAGQVTDALIALNWETLKPLLLTSAAVGIGVGAVGVVNTALQSLLDLSWRTWLTEKLLGEWLNAKAYYDIEREGSLTNADQRIAEDVRLFVDQTLNLSINFVGVIVRIFTYTAVLWGLSGSLSFTAVGLAIAIPGYMVYVAFADNIANLALVHWVGKRLIGLNMERQGFEADYRFAAVQVRENAEQIAFYRGERNEFQRLLHRFAQVRQNVIAMVIRMAKVSMTTTTYNHLTSTLPILVALPRYLAGEITMGGITTITGAYNALSQNLNFFSQAYLGWTNWLAVTNRVRDLQWAINKAQARKSGFQIERAPAAALSTGPIQLLDPLQHPLARIDGLRIGPGERWIIRGPSGSGKSTLMRALAGLWPHGSGRITVPDGAKMMFLPQRSYLPTGSFKATMCYPEPVTAFDDEECRQVLAYCGLDKRITSLEAYDNWQQQLSGGEQQRVAFARVLLHRPDFVFLDEATSAMDPELECKLYTALIQRLPNSAVVSVAHREALAQFHDHTLTMSTASGSEKRTETALCLS